MYARKRRRSTAASRDTRLAPSGPPLQRRKQYNARPGYGLSTRTGFPTEIYSKLKYTHTIQLSGTSGAIAPQVWSGNAPYDPDATLVGHQPYFYDQMSAIYGRYMVYASKIEILSGTNSSVDARVVLRPAIPSTPTGNMDLECERPNAKCWYVVGDSPHPKITSYARTHQIYGTQSKKLDGDYAGLTTSTPVNRWYWLMAIQATDGASSVTCQFTVSITYYCRFYDRKTLASS